MTQPRALPVPYPSEQPPNYAEATADQAATPPPSYWELQSSPVGRVQQLREDPGLIEQLFRRSGLAFTRVGDITNWLLVINALRETTQVENPSFVEAFMPRAFELICLGVTFPRVRMLLQGPIDGPFVAHVATYHDMALCSVLIDYINNGPELRVTSCYCFS